MADERRQGGFTLIETVVALAILAIGFGALLRLVSIGLAAGKQAEVLSTETALARSLLAHAGADQPLAVGVTEGEAGQGYHWRRTVRPLQEPDGSPPPLGVMAVEVGVAVRREPRDPSVAVTTLRLLPVEDGRPSTRPPFP